MNRCVAVLALGAGAMHVGYGDPSRERIVLNEDSLWTGKEISTDKYAQMGWYQMLGELFVEVGGSAAAATTDVQEYRRSLDIGTAIHTVSYKVGGVTYRREAFASHPDGVMVLRCSSDRPGALSGAMALKGAHVADFQTLFNRVSLDVGTTPPDRLALRSDVNFKLLLFAFTAARGEAVWMPVTQW